MCRPITRTIGCGFWIRSSLCGFARFFHATKIPDRDTESLQRHRVSVPPRILNQGRSKMKTLRLFFSTIRNTLTSPLALAVYAFIYAVLVASFFKFIWTREATLWQVFLTYALMVLIPVEFFVYQAAIIDRVRNQSFRWPAILIDAFKFLLGT